jgi:hypothetical protein
LPVNQSIIETEYEENINENTSSTTGSEINNNNNNNTSESKIPALYILEEYYVNRKIIPGNGDEHFVEANEFLKNLDDLSLIGKVEYLSDYLPKLKLEIDNETDAVKKERLKLIYVLS